jgi:hypothetical protein
MQVYDYILQEGSIDQARQVIIGGVVSDAGISTQSKPTFSNYVDTVENVEIYYDFGADYYYFAPADLHKQITGKQEGIEVIMKCRENWTIEVFKEAYKDEWEDFDSLGLAQCFERMEEHIYHKYELDYIIEVIENEILN